MSFRADVSKRRLFAIVLLVISALCLAAGLLLPIVRFGRLYFFSETPSLLELVGGLWHSGDQGLALVVGLFSIVLPIAKLVWLAVELMWPRRPGGFLARLMPTIARWSMMDVMLVALTVFAAKTSGLAVAITQPGLWFYAASALMAGLLPIVLSHPART
ncbi:MAG: paraquat-inducible protein A [Neorhizobium sp.]|nr:paraquat-inducible protein A [Neorhizobium sp.]